MKQALAVAETQHKREEQAGQAEFVVQTAEARLQAPLPPAGEEQGLRLHLDMFEGPFDLLLTLLEKNKLDITEIPISLIADQYVDFLFGQQHFDVEIASEFLVMASTLLHLKSKRLLPKPVEEPEEMTEEELLRRLQEYKRFQGVSVRVGEMLEAWSGAMYREAEELTFPKRPVHYTIDPAQLAGAYETVGQRYRESRNDNRQKMERILKVERVSLREKIRQVLRTVRVKTKATFSDLFSLRKQSRAEVVTGFLAVLELDRRKQVKVVQQKLFGDIYLYPGKDSDLELDQDQDLEEYL